MTDLARSRQGAMYESSFPGGAFITLTVIMSTLFLTGNLSMRLFHGPSLFLVVGITIFTCLLSFSKEDLILTLDELGKLFGSKVCEKKDRLEHLLSLSREVRTSGKLVLEQEAARTYDRFLRVCLELAVDETDPIRFRKVVHNEIQQGIERGQRAVAVLATTASYAPAAGLIGTMIGLANMLSDLNSPDAIGPSMALALITTLYGTVLGQAILFPLANRLQARFDLDGELKRLTVAGIEGLIEGESPIQMKHQLSLFMLSDRG